MNTYRPRTQMHIKDIDTLALAIRESGITNTRQAIQEVSEKKDSRKAQHLIASMNYGVSQVQRELRSRSKNKRK